MNTLQIFKNAYKQYYCQGSESLYREQDGFSILYSGINSIYHNYVFVNNIFKDIPLNISFDAGVLSFLHDKESVQSISKNISFFSSSIIVSKNIKDNYKPKIYDSLNIKRVQDNPTSLNDYIELVSYIRNINKNELDKVFNLNSVMHDNNYIYLVYVDNVAVGFLGASVVDNCAFATESFVLEKYRNTGILTALADKAMFDGLEKNIDKYFCLISSQYSLKVVEKQGYKYQIPCNLWKHDSMI